jgi:UDP-glucose 4-epimerase
MRVLVTGAAGFLGRHIARAFRDSGWEVRGFDVAPFDEPGVESTQGDLTEANSVERAIESQEVVAHVGAIGDVYLAGEHPALAAEVNVVGTANVVEAAARHGVRVIYASTWEVYGRPHYEPIDEDHPTMPDHPYSITKLAGESLVLAAAHLRGVPALALRLGTAYGSGLRANSVFRVFIDSAMEGRAITIQGDGSQSRQFTHATDIARAFEAAAKSSVTGLPINVVGDESVTIKELATQVVSRVPTKLVFGDLRAGDAPSAHVSSSRAESLLGWSPTVGFAEGLDDLIASTARDRR